MKKILFLVTQSEMGGAQRYIYEVARGLNKAKYRIVVAAGEGDGGLLRKLESAGIESRQLKQMKRVPRPWQITSAIWEICNLLKIEKPDILFLCSTTVGLLGSIAKIFYKVKTVYRIGGWAFGDPRAFWKNWLILLAEKLTAPLKDVIIVNSEIDKHLASRCGVAPENKIVKIYNGIDPNTLNFLAKGGARQKLSIGDGLVVGTVANFYKTKGLEYLIEAAKQVKAQFVIIGDGRLRPKLENLIKKYHLENKVSLLGRIPDAYRYLKAFDVFALPSLKEGFPWIILEAAASEVPIVATKVGAIPEILEEEFLVESGDANGLAKKISWLLKHPTKTELARGFTSQQMIVETEKALARLSPPVVQ